MSRAQSTQHHEQHEKRPAALIALLPAAAPDACATPVELKGGTTQACLPSTHQNKRTRPELAVAQPQPPCCAQCAHVAQRSAPRDGQRRKGSKATRQQLAAPVRPAAQPPARSLASWQPAAKTTAQQAPIAYYHTASRTQAHHYRGHQGRLARTAPRPAHPKGEGRAAETRERMPAASLDEAM